MTSPIRTRRAIGSGSARTTGESGWPSSVPNRHAEIMKRPRPVASARYSGQCSRTAPLMLLPALLDQLRHQPRPTRLVIRANAGARVAMEVFVEKDQVAPVGIGLECLESAVDWPAAIRSAQEDARKAPRQLAGHIPERQELSGSRRELGLELAAVEVVEALERFHDEEIHREPDRAPPVRVAAEERRRR